MSELRTRFAVSTTNRPLPLPAACQAVVNGGPTGGLTGAPNAGDTPTGTTTLTETISTATHTPTVLRSNFVTIRHPRWVGRNVQEYLLLPARRQHLHPIIYLDEARTRPYFQIIDQPSSPPITRSIRCLTISSSRIEPDRNIGGVERPPVWRGQQIPRVEARLHTASVQP